MKRDQEDRRAALFGTMGSQVQILPLRPNFPYSLRLFRSANKPPDASGTVIGTEIARAGLRLLAKCLGNLGPLSKESRGNGNILVFDDGVDIAERPAGGIRIAAVGNNLDGRLVMT